MSVASGERSHRITLHAPEGTRGDGTAQDLATAIPAKIGPVPLAFQQQERLAAGGQTRQTLYSINIRYRADVDSDLVLVEECHTQREFQILTMIPSDKMDEIDLTCVVGNRPVAEEELS